MKDITGAQYAPPTPQERLEIAKHIHHSDEFYESMIKSLGLNPPDLDLTEIAMIIAETKVLEADCLHLYAFCARQSDDWEGLVSVLKDKVNDGMAALAEKHASQAHPAVDDRAEKQTESSSDSFHKKTVAIDLDISKAMSRLAELVAKVESAKDLIISFSELLKELPSTSDPRTMPADFEHNDY